MHVANEVKILLTPILFSYSMLGCNHLFGCSLFSQRDAFLKAHSKAIAVMSLNLIRLYFRQNNHNKGIFSPTLMTAHHHRHSHCTVLLANARAHHIQVKMHSQDTRQHSQSLSKRLCLYLLWLYFCFMFFFFIFCVCSIFISFAIP